MVGEESEICGFLDVKLLSGRYTQKVRKRALAPWKVWRRRWCSIRKLGPGLGIEVQFDCGISSNGERQNEKESSIVVPSDSIVYRTQSRTKQFAFGIFPAKERKPLLYLSGSTETETQKWMASVRQLLKPRRHRFMEGAYNISMVDNTHSKSSGLTGLHGDLVASRIGVFVKDVHSGEIIENLEWKELGQFHLSTAGRPEDVKRVCVIHTTKEFRGGVGELHVFCLDASRLLQDLVTQGRGPKYKRISQRPLSLSEGDLRMSGEETTSFQVPKSKVTAGIINAGLGLFLSSHSGSEAKALNEIGDNSVLSKIANFKISSVVENVYQPEPASSDFADPPRRRVSNISVASGIYEEISEDVEPSRAAVHSNIYEDTEDLILSLQLDPPPLPPRQKPEIKINGASTSGSEEEITSASPIDEEATVKLEDIGITARRISVDSSNYVPMSPRLKDITLYKLQGQSVSQEEDYVVMR